MPGRKVIVRPVSGLPQITINHFLADQVFPRLVAYDGNFVFHAGAVRLGDAAIVLMGESGSGKSTLASSFDRAGQRLMGDDALVASNLDGVPAVQPVAPRAETIVGAELGLAAARPNTTARDVGRERFVATAVHLTYILKKGGGASKTLPAVDDVPIAGTSDKANNNAKMGANIIGPKGGAALLNEVPATTSGNGYPTPDDVVELKVGISLVGALSGSGVPVTTGVVYFPINVFRSNACANGYKPATAACPANGQDAVAPVCN